MIVCRLELWPYGDKDDARHMGTLVIINDEKTSTQTGGRLGSYDVTLHKDGETGPALQLHVDGHERKNHAWNLVRMVLDQAAEMNGGTI